MAKKVYFIGGPFAGRIMGFQGSPQVIVASMPRICGARHSGMSVEAVPVSTAIHKVAYELRPWQGHFIATPNGAPPLDALIDFYFKEPHDHG